MPLETSPSFIDGLIPEWPLPTDPQKDGDDHIRMIKQVLKNTFPTLNTALTATAESINLVTNQIRHRAYDNVTDPANPVPEHFKSTDAGETTHIPMLVGTPTTAQLNTMLPDAAVSWHMVRTLLMPVGHVLTTKKGGNPAEWLGFGTWVQLVGGVWGAGDAGDTNGIVVHTPLGYTPGFHVVESGHMKYFEVGVTIDAGGEHQHDYTGYFTNNDTSTEGGGAPVSTIGGQIGYTGWSGNHAHTGRVGIGTGTPTPYLPARNGVYVWERTA